MYPAEFFADHTFRMVLMGTSGIGVVAGALGAFAYARKQTLISDVISHAALPGTLVAFLVAVFFGLDGRNMLFLIIGAVIIGSLAAWLANAIAETSKIRIDTAMAVTLALFFGAGMVLMRIITNAPLPGKGGIQDYLFGNASTMTYADLTTSLGVGGLAILIMVLCWKEFTVRAFDPIHCQMMGFSGRVVDGLMFLTIVIATVIGVKSVGLVLMVAFVVTPPAAARQWVNSLPAMVTLSAIFGGVGSAVGAYASIAVIQAPTGPLIVITLFVILLISLIFAPKRSLVLRAVRRAQARRRLELEVAA